MLFVINHLNERCVLPNSHLVTLQEEEEQSFLSLLLTRLFVSNSRRLDELLLEVVPVLDCTK